MATVRSLGAQTCGVWTRQQALDAGVSPARLRWLLETGTWQRLLPGAYTDGGTTTDAAQRAWAAVLTSGPDAVAAGRTAARLHGLPLVDDDDPASGRSELVLGDVISPHRLRGRAGVAPHRSALAAGDRTTVSRCPVTSVSRTLLDLAGLLRPDAMVAALDAALATGLVDTADLEARAVGRSRALRQALEAADGRAESPLESLGRLVVLPVVPTLVPQLPVFDQQGRVVARLDLGDRDARLAVEFDGRSVHSAPSAVAADRRREERLRARGWIVVRATWWDVRCRPEELRRRLLRVADRHAA